ncbi:MAG: hypothetical protein RLO02_16295 [Roseitalea porphyridii]
MLSRIDRAVLAVPDAADAAARWIALLEAEPAGVDTVKTLGAKRTRLRLGRGWVELLEPDGAGPIGDVVRRRGPHLFAAGAASPSLPDLLLRLEDKGLDVACFGDQGFTDAGDGLRIVLSPDTELSRVGAIDNLYEASLLVPDAAATTARVADLFGLDPAPFVPIKSDTFGYDGTLTLFRPRELHRFEIITPTDMTRTMGRYFGKFGPSLYMCFAETDRLPSIESRAAERGDGITPLRPAGRAADLTSDQTFLHPPSLGGMMLGMSRPTMAWTWSGAPERVSTVG